MAGKLSIHESGTMLDYILWRGDLSFEADPWNDVDSLIAAELCYSNFGENVQVFDNPQRLTIGDLATSDVLTRYPQVGLEFAMKYRRPMLEMLPGSRRFRDIRILDQVNDVDSSRNIQFSAMTMKVPGVGTVICFRGTEPTVVGWKEDFMMSFVSPVPAQTAAAAYLENAAEKTEGDLILTGHSKGGNLAIYAAACASPAIQDRLRAVCSFDGPGLDDETIASDGYRKIQPLIHSVIPTDSMVGLLMNYHQNYRVVESTVRPMLQHELATWKVIGSRFVEKKQVSVRSQVMDQTIHEWLKTCTMEQRKIFTDAVFSLFEKKRGTDPWETEKRPMDEGSGRMVRGMLHRLIVMQTENTCSVRILKPLQQAAEELLNRLRGETGERFKSDVVRIDNHGNGLADAVRVTLETAELNGLSHQNTLRLQLFTEEMMSMIRAVAGDVDGTFWIETEGSEFDLNLTVRTELDRKKREMLIASTSSGRNDAARSFLGRLRDAFEQAMASDREDVYFDLPAGGTGEKSKEWDRYEQSVLLRLADNVRIAIRGGVVSMTVEKVFA